MNKFVVVSLAALGGGIALVPIVALGKGGVAAPIARLQGETKIRANVYVGETALGGLTPEAAELKLRQWWEVKRKGKLTIKADGKTTKLTLTPTMLGVGLDDAATVAGLPLSGIMPDSEPDRADFKPVFLKIAEPDKSLVAALTEKASKPARVVWRNGAAVRTTEGASQDVDASTVADHVIASLEKGNDFVMVDMKKATKHVPDENLKEITHVVTSFSTRFSAGNRPRSANIKLAASFFDGQVLMPGDRISYNETVGQRTLKRGFKVAGVYIDGRHDTGVGGGICQVSTTLYNAGLFADMKVVRRRNHSLPVPYVPLGRDATVDWGNIDLVLENASDSPVAIESAYTPGRLTFRVLGAKPDPNVKIDVEGSGVRTSPGRTITRRDPSIPSGVRRVAESGGSARSVSTVRIVKQDGKVVRRDSLGTSYYGGSPRVILVGSGPRPKPRVVPPPAKPVTVPPPAASVPPPVTEPGQTESLP